MSFKILKIGLGKDMYSRKNQICFMKQSEYDGVGNGRENKEIKLER